jgi:hypothetical protein
MKYKILNALLIAVGIVAFGIFLHSCKKTDKAGNLITQDDGTAAVIKATEARYGKSSAPIVYPVNTVADFLITDKDGNEVIVRKKRDINGRVLTSCSNMNCAQAEGIGDPSGLQPDYTLNNAEVYAGCGTANGTTVKVTWDLSVPYTVYATSGALTSKGRIRFLNSTGTVLYSNIAITPITVTALGADPNCSAHLKFRVTYSLSNVLDSYLGNNNRMECALLIYTNCSFFPTVITAWTPTITFPASSTYALPCNRIDKLWYNPSTGTAVTQCATVAGAYVTCPAPPANFVRTTSQQVEYRKVTNTTDLAWTAQTSTVNNGTLPPVSGNTISATVSSCCGVLYFKQIVQGAWANGWLIRYRNVYTGCAVITPAGATWPAGSYTTEYWIY